MRESATWKTMFCVLGILAALTPSPGQTPTPPAPTSKQIELVGQLTGVGRLKFGMSSADFTPGTLATDPTQNSALGVSYFVDNDLLGITWGQLHPDHIYLQFYFDHLVDIRLHFTESFGNLLAVTRAAFQKYGSVAWDRNLNVDGTFQTAALWTGGIKLPNGTIPESVAMQLAFPYQIPPGSDETVLTKKTAGMLELSAPILINKLMQSHIDDLDQQALKGHDLEKIKGDL